MRSLAMMVTIFVMVVSAGLPVRADYLVDRGQEIADNFCSMCHATRLDDESAFKPAPPFRDLHKRYDVEHLAEGLAEGLMSGHEDMPVFMFSTDDIDAFLAYLDEFEK